MSDPHFKNQQPIYAYTENNLDTGLEFQPNSNLDIWNNLPSTGKPQLYTYPSIPSSASTIDLEIEQSWINTAHQTNPRRSHNWHNYPHQNSISSHSSSRSIKMSIPPITLDQSWRSDPHSPTRRNGVGKEREILWDIQNLPNGLDALGITTNPESSYSGKGKNYDEHDNNNTKQPMSVDVLAKVMDTSKGRDKVLKCVQYSLRTYLYLLSIISRIRPLSPWFKSNSKRMKLAISGLSLTRKCLLLLNPLHPLSDLLSHEPMSPRTLVGHLIDLISALSDDIYCLAKLGIIGKRAGDIADRWSNRLWLLTTIMGLYKLHLKTIPKIANSSSALEKRRADLNEAKWTNRKLVADLAFVSYDVFELDFPIIEEPMKCFTGLLAGLISAFKLYNQQWDASVGKG